MREDDADYGYPYKWAEGTPQWESPKNTRWSDADAFWGMDWPTYAAVGTTGGTADPLADELERVPMTFTYDYGEDIARAKFSAKFTAKIGVGEWEEAGLFYGNAGITVLDSCDIDTDWTSDNTLSVSTSEVQDGDGSLRSSGTNNLSFRNQALTPSYAATYTENDKLQFWYYIDDVDNLASGVTVEISSDTTDDTHEYQWTIAKGDLEDGWNWFSHRINTFDSKVGSPDINAIVRFRMHSSKDASGAVEHIDKIRLFQEGGQMWERVVLTTPTEKQYGETKWLYWILDFDVNPTI